MDIRQFPVMIEELHGEDYAAIRSNGLRARLQRILHYLDPSAEPHETHIEQVRALRKLIFLKGDVQLVARTGFGKNIIFHALSILTREIPLQNMRNDA